MKSPRYGHLGDSKVVFSFAAIRFHILTTNTGWTWGTEPAGSHVRFSTLRGGGRKAPQTEFFLPRQKSAANGNEAMPSHLAPTGHMGYAAWLLYCGDGLATCLCVARALPFAMLSAVSPLTTLLRAGALRLLALCGIAAAALALNGGNQPALAQTTADREWPGPPVPGVPRADEPVSDRVRHEDGSETWFYRCRHRSPNDLQEFVRRYVSSSGRVNHFAENNMLFIRDTPARLQFIERVLRRLDVARPQVLIEVKVISLTYSSDFELGFESSWNLDDKTAGNNQLFFRGFDLTFHPDAFLSALSANQGNKTAAQNDFRGTSIFFEAQGATRHRLGRLDATLRMLQEANQANIVARPAVLVEAGYEARIEAGQEVPIQYRTITNNVPIIGTEFKRVGVSLSLKPETIGEHTVRLTVKPELSSVVQFFDPGGLGLTNPIIRRTSASTSVTMQSRQTLELGGLRSSRTLIRQTGIPLLMDIPILGYLFRASKREQRRQDVVFFITPTILDGSDGRLTASLAREYEYFGSRTIDSPTHGGE